MKKNSKKRCKTVSFRLMKRHRKIRITVLITLWITFMEITRDEESISTTMKF